MVQTKYGSLIVEARLQGRNRPLFVDLFAFQSMNFNHELLISIPIWKVSSNGWYRQVLTFILYVQLCATYINVWANASPLIISDMIADMIAR